MSGEAWSEESAYDPRWTDLAYQLIATRPRPLIEAVVVRRGTVLTDEVTGPCPRCRDLFTHTEPRTAVVGRAAAIEAQPAEEQWLSIELACGCAGAHPGRPAGRVGCGIRYSVPAQVAAP